MILYSTFLSPQLLPNINRAQIQSQKIKGRSIAWSSRKKMQKIIAVAVNSNTTYCQLTLKNAKKIMKQWKVKKNQKKKKALRGPINSQILEINHLKIDIKVERWLKGNKTLGNTYQYKFWMHTKYQLLHLYNYNLRQQFYKTK